MRNEVMNLVMGIRIKYVQRRQHVFNPITKSARSLPTETIQQITGPLQGCNNIG